MKQTNNDYNIQINGPKLSLVYIENKRNYWNISKNILTAINCLQIVIYKQILFVIIIPKNNA